MEWVSGNIFIRPNPMEMGEVRQGHTHNFDHTTIVFKGSVRVRAWKTIGDQRALIAERDFAAPSHFLIRKDIEHEITALEDGTVFWCVYSHRTPRGEVIQHYDGWQPAYD